MNVTFRQLQLFRSLVSTGSISGAAKEAGITQPTASVHLKELTEAVGMPLYEVIGRKVFLTEAGRSLASAAQGVQAEWESFEQNIQTLKGGESGMLRVSMVNTAQYFAPRILGSFCSARPGVEASMELLNRDGVIERLRLNQDDLYIMSRPPTDLALTCTAFMPNPLVVVAPRDHPLARRNPVRPEELAGFRFLARERGSGTRLAADDFFRQRRCALDVRFELGSNEAILEAVAGGMGLAIVSAHALREGAHAGLVTLDVDGFPLLSNWQIVHPSGRKLSPLAAAFRTHLIAEARSMSVPA
ncbi:MAG: HTH-type transcriptional activator CmpR [Verrucomicrobiota bacterium]|jgi:DNA-binding transcriptional LysR family regulator